MTRLVAVKGTGSISELSDRVHHANGKGIVSSGAGRPVTWTALQACRFRDGWITEVWSEADFVGARVQIGAVQVPG